MNATAEETELFVDEPQLPPVIIGRSELERWATCPHQGAIIDRGMVTTGSTLADVGNEAHRIIGHVVKLRNEEGADIRMMREVVEELAAASRPDIQPDVIDALKRCYPILQHITSKPYDSERSADDLLNYDGGEGGKSGQIACDIIGPTDERGPIRLTCEVDLLMATDSKEEVELCDWKSGWRHWTATDVLQSFQFQFYAYLVMRKYPSVNVVRVRIFMPRYGTSTSVVEFRREQMRTIGQRLTTAVELFLEHRESDLADIPAWPEAAKCSICDAALYCKLAHKPAGDLGVDPAAYLSQYVVIAEVESRMRSLMSAHVKRTKGDIVAGKNAFGANAPKTSRAAACKLYSIGGDAEETE